MMNFDGKRIAVIGLGYVGLPLAVEFGRTRDVVGLDLKVGRIEKLRSGIDSTKEVTPEDLAAAKHLRYTTEIEDITDCDIYIITVPTPVDQVNRPDLMPIRKASSAVGSVLSKGNVVIYESTVYPGCTEEICVPILESSSGLRFNEDFFCGYSPERINPGDQVNTLTKVVKVTAGSTPEAAAEIDALYGSIIERGTYLASSIKVAEAAKVIENIQRDINIALVNELSIIFNHLNIDTVDVLNTAGSKWNFLPFRPGLVGGHCIGVDPYYLTHKAEEVGYHPQVILSGRRINDEMAHYAARSVIKMMSKNGISINQSRVCILGVTFKENCPDIRNTKVVDLIREFEDWGIEVIVSDVHADGDEVFAHFGVNLTSLDEVKDVDAVVVAVAHDEYSNLEPSYLRALCKSKSAIIADIKSVFDREDLKACGFEVFRL